MINRQLKLSTSYQTRKMWGDESIEFFFFFGYERPHWFSQVSNSARENCSCFWYWNSTISVTNYLQGLLRQRCLQTQVLAIHEHRLYKEVPNPQLMLWPGSHKGAFNTSIHLVRGHRSHRRKGCFDWMAKYEWVDWPVPPNKVACQYTQRVTVAQSTRTTALVQ